MVKPKKNIKKRSRNENSFLGYRTITQFVKKHKIWVLVILILVGFFGWKYTSIYLEKRDFLSKQKQLEQLADKVASQYPPDSRSSDEYCRYQSQKISRGSRSCIMDVNFIYNDKNADLPNGLIKFIEISQGTHFKLGNLSNQSIVGFSENINYSSSDFVIANVLNSGDFCSSYIYYSKDQGTKLHISCAGKAKSEYFPVKK